MARLPVQTLLLLALLPSLTVAQSPAIDTVLSPAQNPAGAYDFNSSGTSTDFSTRAPLGTWSPVVANAGVSGVHWAITHFNTLIMIDRSDFDTSYVKDSAGGQASAAVLNLADVSAPVRGLDVIDNMFCSAGQMWPNGTLVDSGGFQTAAGDPRGYNAIRKLDTCAAEESCDFYEDPGVTMLAKRWYPSAHLMPDGVRMVFLGGAVQGDVLLLESTDQSSDTYEMYPRTAPADAALRTLPVLTRAFPAPLYPFVHLMPNGQFFVMANYHAALFDFDTGEEVVLPDMPGAISRSYPYTGTSVLLPMSVENKYTAEIMVCGGSAFSPTASRGAAASASCGRIRPLDAKPTWVMETMPDPRVGPYAIITANGQIIIINGARQGHSGTGTGVSNSHDPVLTPALYHPGAAAAARWTNLAPENTPRLYHGLAILGPDSCLMTGGSSPYECPLGSGPTCFGAACTGADDGCYPNEFSINKFCPPYVSSGIPQPKVAVAPAQIGYGAPFVLTCAVRAGLAAPAVRAAIMNPGFATHSQIMGQRFVWLEVDYTTLSYNASNGGATVTVKGPLGKAIAPPGYYYLFCHDSNIPSTAQWVQLL